jgi:hypothetical protein
MKFIALLLFPLFSFAQIKPDQKISLLDNKIEIFAPRELSKMSDEIWTFKYHNLPRPEVALTDENGEVNFLIDLTQQPASQSQIGQYKDFRINNLLKRADVKILKDGVKSVNGKNIGFIKFSSSASDQNIFNYYFFSVVNGKIVLFNFNCIEKLQGTWEKIGDEMLSSLKIK